MEGKSTIFQAVVPIGDLGAPGKGELVMEEKSIIFQAVVPIGERRSMMNAWFKIQPALKISGPFHARQPPFRLGISSAFVGSSLYTIGGRVPNHFVLSDCISWLDTSNAFKAWETSKLPSRCVDSVLGVYGESLYIFPGVWKYGYYHMDEDKYLTTRKGYIWNTNENNCNKIGTIEPPKQQWGRIRACAPLDKGLLIAMDGEKNNFFLYKPEKNDWEICVEFEDPLPKFIGETSFAASNGRLYILEVQEESPALLYIYDIKKGKLIGHKPIPEFDDDFWSMDEWDRVVRLVPVADNKLCLLWLGPVSYENENRWPPVRILHYLKFKVSGHSNSVFEVEDNKVFRTNITDLLDCLPWDLEQVEAEAKGESQPLTQDVKLKAIIPPVTTMAARENAILFQAVVPSGERKLMMNAWFKIQPTAQIFGSFHGRQPFRLGISSTFVGSSLYTIGGKVPSSRLPKPCDISWLDTCSPFNGWETGELPSPCVDSVICVDGYSLYILTELEGYIWNTRDNQCLQTRIHLPRVEGRDQKQRPRICACAALHGQGLLIAMDGENNTNLYLHPEPENEARDWERFGTPLPAFTNEISFAASNGRLYILEFPNNPPASLYIYDTNTREIVQNHKIDSLLLHGLWTPDEKDRVVHLVPVADDMLCFLWLGPFENGNGWPPVKTLYYLKLKFSFNPIKFEIVGDKRIPTNITNLLNCLPCGPEQFRAEVDPLDAFQKQVEDNASAEAIGTRGKGKSKRTQLVDPSPPQKFEKGLSMDSGYPQRQAGCGYGPPYVSPLAALVPSQFPPGTDHRIVDCFQLADADGNGLIDDQELQRALSSCNPCFSLRTVHLLMYVFTNSNARKIGPKEFTSLFNDLQNWRANFDRFDKDRSGRIDVNELRDALQSMGLAVSPVVLELLVSIFDKSGGKIKSIGYDNFIECCLTVKGLTEKFKEKDISYSGSATFDYEGFMSTFLPFLIA